MAFKQRIKGELDRIVFPHVAGGLILVVQVILDADGEEEVLAVGPGPAGGGQVVGIDGVLAVDKLRGQVVGPLGEVAVDGDSFGGEAGEGVAQGKRLLE